MNQLDDEIQQYVEKNLRSISIFRLRFKRIDFKFNRRIARWQHQLG